MELTIDENIKLELINDSHSQALFEIAAAHRNYLRQWLVWVDEMKSVAFIENYIRGSNQRNVDGNEFAFVIIKNKKLIGRIGIYKINAINQIGEIGYWIVEDQQGKGIVTTCCKALIHFCFNELKLNRIEIICGTENYKSQIIAERLGFTKEGIIRQGALVHNSFIDLCLFSLLKPDLTHL
jgi:ribosomal-protein-serine acetyltransferase